MERMLPDFRPVDRPTNIPMASQPPRQAELFAIIYLQLALNDKNSVLLRQSSVRSHKSEIKTQFPGTVIAVEMRPNWVKLKLVA